MATLLSNGQQFVGEQKVFVSNIVFLFSGWGGGETTSHSWLTTLLLFTREKQVREYGMV